MKMLDYAAKLTRYPDEIHQEEVNQLQKTDFSDEDILSINLITAYFNFANRIALVWALNLHAKKEPVINTKE